MSGPSPFERAAEIAPTPEEALAMRRTQDANLREVRRLTNLLIKLKRQRQPPPGQEAREEPPNRAHSRLRKGAKSPT